MRLKAYISFYERTFIIPYFLTNSKIKFTPCIFTNEVPGLEIGTSGCYCQKKRKKPGRNLSQKKQTLIQLPTASVSVEVWKPGLKHAIEVIYLI